MYIDDYNTLDCAFIGGDGCEVEENYCPVDKLFLNYNIQVSGLENGQAKETYEIFYINSDNEIDEKAEENSRH